MYTYAMRYNKKTNKYVCTCVKYAVIALINWVKYFIYKVLELSFAGVKTGILVCSIINHQVRLKVVCV